MEVREKGAMGALLLTVQRELLRRTLQSAGNNVKRTPRRRHLTDKVLLPFKEIKRGREPLNVTYAIKHLNITQT